MKKNLRVANYHAIFEPAKEGGYNVSFPSFPGCFTFGETFEEAHEHARDVLELWLEEMKAQRLSIPSHTRHPIVDEIRARLPA